MLAEMASYALGTITEEIVVDLFHDVTGASDLEKLLQRVIGGVHSFFQTKEDKVFQRKMLHFRVDAAAGKPEDL